MHPEATMPNHEQSDEWLVDQFLAGDSNAFNQLVLKYRDPIYRYCLRMLRNQEDAMDLSQDVFVKVHQKAAGFKKLSSFKTWIYKIATNMAFNRIRTRRFLVPLESLFGHGHQARILETMINDEQASLLNHHIAALPPKQRQVVILRIQEELSFKEIAEVVGSPEGTVKANFFNAVKNLQKKIGGLDHG